MYSVLSLRGNLTAIRRTTESVALGAIAVFAILGIRHLSDGFFSAQDEGVLIVYPDLILRGYLPYKDFAAFYSPAGFYLLAGVFLIFEESVFIERSVGALYWFLIVLAVFFIGSRVNRSTAVLSAATALAYLSLWSALAADVHLGAHVCMLFSLALACKDCNGNELLAKRLVTLAGVVAGTALWFKQDLGAVAIVATLVAIDPLHFRRLRTFLAGVAIPVFALIVFAIVIGPIDVFDGLVLDPLRSSPGRFMPLQLSWDLGVIAGCIALQCVIAIRLPGTRVPYHLIWMARGAAALSLGYFISMLHRTGPGSIGMYGFLVVSLTVVSLSIIFLRMGVAPRERATAILIFFLLGLLPIGIMHFMRTKVPEEWKLTQDWVYSGARKVPVTLFGNSKASDLQRLLDEINRRARPGQGIFVGQSDLRFSMYNDTFIYYLLPYLRPVSRYLQLDPGCANRPDSGLSKEISSADWLILTTRYDFWKEPNASAVPGSAEPNNIVRTHFCLQSQYGEWNLFHRCRSVHSGSLGG